MKGNHLMLGMLMILAGGAIFASSWSFSKLPNQAFGSDTMPRFVGAFGLLTGIVLLIKAVRTGERIPHAEVSDWARSPQSAASVAAAIGAVALYTLASGVTGFLPLAVALMLGLMLLRRTPVIVAISVSILAGLAIQQGFGRFLMVPLPRSGALDILW